jgi:hypothetical protein
VRGAISFARRGIVAICLALLCVFWGGAASWAVDATPSPTPTEQPSAPAASSGSTVALSDDQYQPLLFAAACVVFLSAATFVASWKRA